MCRLRLRPLHPSIEDGLQGAVVGSEVPNEAPKNFSVALRGSGTVLGWDLAATAYYGWDRTPKLRVDNDLLLLLQRGDEIIADPQLLVNDQDLSVAAQRVQQKIAIGQELLSATYQRMWLFALEGEGIIGDIVVRADLGYSPRQLYYDDQQRFHGKHTFSFAAGAEYTRGVEWLAQLTWLTVMVFDPPPDALLVGFNERKTVPRDRAVDALYGFAATVRWMWEDQNVSLSVTGLYTINPRDLVITAEAAYTDWEPHQMRLGGVYIAGPNGSATGNFRHNDFLYLAYRATW